MIAHTAPLLSKNGETLGHYHYAVLAEPTATFNLAWCLTVFVPTGGTPTVDCRHISTSELDEAAPETEGQFLAAYLDAQQGLAVMLSTARAFGQSKPAPAVPTHIVTTVEAVTLTDDEQPEYLVTDPHTYPY